MKKKKIKKEEFKEVKLHYSNGYCSIILNMDNMFAEYMNRKHLKFTKIKVAL